MADDWGFPPFQETSIWEIIKIGSIGLFPIDLFDWIIHPLLIGNMAHQPYGKNWCMNLSELRKIGDMKMGAPWISMVGS